MLGFALVMPHQYSPSEIKASLFVTVAPWHARSNLPLRRLPLHKHVNYFFYEVPGRRKEDGGGNSPTFMPLFLTTRDDDRQAGCGGDDKTRGVIRTLNTISHKRERELSLLACPGEET